jgi:hypothetical protein
MRALGAVVGRRGSLSPAPPRNSPVARKLLTGVATEVTMVQRGHIAFGSDGSFRFLLRRFTLALCLTTAACSGESGGELGAAASPDQGAQIVHVTRLEDGGTVEFVELDYGLVAYSGSFAVGVQPIAERIDFSGNVVEVFRRLHPQTTVPESLVLLAERQAERAARPVEPETFVDEVVDDSVAEEDVEFDGDMIVPKDSYHEWFQADVCNTNVLTTENSSQRVKVVDVCALHKSDDKANNVTNAKQAYGAAFTYNGTITYSAYRRARTTDPWSLVFTNSIPSEDGRWYLLNQDGSTRLNARFAITDAANNQHHRAVVVDAYLCKSGCSWNGSVCGCGI